MRHDGLVETMEALTQNLRAQEHADMVERRRRKCTLAYRDLLERLFPFQWLYAPTVMSVDNDGCSAFPSLSRIIQMTDEPTAEDWAEATRSLPADLSRQIVANLFKISSLVLSCPPQIPQSLDLVALSDDSSKKQVLEAQLGVMDAAHLVFQLRNHIFLFGRDVLHALETHYSDTLKFSTRGSDAVKCIARELKKDALTVTVPQLDAACADKLLRCVQCRLTDRFFTWRAYVSRFFMHAQSAYRNKL